MALLLAYPCVPRSIGYDGRALILDGQRRVLISGSVHYPRSTPGMWPSLAKRVKDAGMDVIETYAFWNGHEPVKGQYDFSGRYDIVRFIQEAQKAGLYVLLRIGPYICGEWDFGGFPGWLKLKKGIAFRTYNAPFMAEMKQWTEKLVAMMKENKLMYTQGGPIIALQIENEYEAFESHYGEAGKKYVKWAAEMATNTSAGVPWIMCYQEDAPENLISTCNGFYCDNWIAQHHKKHPNQPAWFTENWPGWFQAWGGAKPVRSAQDVAFSVLRWFARGGTLMNYYMFHGGSNFDRTAGATMTTTYDYDAPIDEYGLPNNPKYAHLQNMHKAIHQFDALIVGQDIPAPVELARDVEAHVYGDIKSDKCVAFVSNINDKTNATVNFNGGVYTVPAWSVSVLKGCKTVIYNSANIVPEYTQKYTMRPVSMYLPSAAEMGWLPEPIATATPPVYFRTPKEQLSLTADLTDYLWYTTIYISDSAKTCTLELEKASNIMHVFLNETYVGTGEKISLRLSRGKNPIQILSNVMGLLNYGADMEKVTKGLVGDVRLCGKSIRENTWRHVVDLLGNVNKYFDPTVAKKLNWATNIQEAVKRPLTWVIKKVLLTPGKNVMALDLSSMGKGYAWVNGHNIGRYYKIVPKGGCSYCDYRGAYNPNKCCTSNGELSQRYYHVPLDWLNQGENVVVLFEETGGDPRGVTFVTRDPTSTCASVYEHWPDNDSYLTLACENGEIISGIQFASFGTPTGECGHFNVGPCHAEKSAEIVRARCVGKAACNVPVNSGLFGDPCSGYTKLLSVQATCAARSE